MPLFAIRQLIHGTIAALLECWQMVQAALADMSIPAVEVQAAEGNDEPELEVSDDPSSAVKLDTSQVPILLTVSQVSQLAKQAGRKRLLLIFVLVICSKTCAVSNLVCCCNNVYLHMQVGKSLAVDLTAEEEFCCTAALQVAVNASGSVCSATKRGPRGLSPAVLQVSHLHLLLVTSVRYAEFHLVLCCSKQCHDGERRAGDDFQSSAVSAHNHCRIRQAYGIQQDGGGLSGVWY